MSSQGRIRIYRQSQENEIYFSEPFTRRQARTDLLLTTSFNDWIIIVRGNIINVKRWQNWYSEETLAKRWKWSRDKVRRYLNYLETIQQIIQQKSKVKSIITIINYDKYQTNDTTDDTTDKHQTIQQTNTIKNNKKKKNEKEWKEIIDDFEKTLNDFISMRKEMKKPMTSKAKELLLKELEKLAPWDRDMQIAIMNKSILNWRLWVFALKEEDKKNNTDPLLTEYERLTRIWFEKWRADDTANGKLDIHAQLLVEKYGVEKVKKIRKVILVTVCFNMWPQ